MLAVGIVYVSDRFLAWRHAAAIRAIVGLVLMGEQMVRS
jgi:hypothetical protein